MATSRNVWLPGAAVWACLPDTISSPARRDDAKSIQGNDRKRRKSSNSVENLSENPDDAPELGFWVKNDQVAFPSTVSEEDDIFCPICLGNIEPETGGAVLQWCMHRFCPHCIEEWSRFHRSCPLCKGEYHGWYYGVQSNSKFQERILPPLDTAGNPAVVSRFHSWQDSRRQERGRGRMPPRHRQGVAAAAASSSRRSVLFPTQRSFGLPRQHQGAQAMRVFEEQAAMKALQWRQSIYNRNLIARPFELRKTSTDTKDATARAERRLEPWVRRELQAVLPNSDHGFLVRLVLGLWFGVESEALHKSERPGRSGGPHMRSSRNVAGSTEVEGAFEKAIKELKRFLGDKAEAFWHELRCFAGSPFTMQAYDTTVVYDNSRRPINRAQLERSSAQRPNGPAIASPREGIHRHKPSHGQRRTPCRSG